MLRSYFKTTWRNLTKRKGFSVLNVFGLALGLAVCLLILLLPLRQWRMGRFHSGAERIHRVITDPPMRAFGRGAADGFATSPAPLAPLVRRAYTGVEAAVRMRETKANLMRGNERVALERKGGVSTQGLFVESSFFGVFDGFEVENGNAQEALRQPFSVVLTHETARKLFGDENPLGQTVRLTETGEFTVTGVLAEPAGRPHLDFDALFSFSTLRARGRSLLDWSSIYDYYTYLLLEEGADPQAVEARLYKSAERLESPTPTFDPRTDFEANPFSLQPLLDIALGGRRTDDIARAMVPRELLLVLLALALVIVGAAGLNYSNLSVARSLTRAREVGVRRTVGATRPQVAGQFLGEAVLVALLAFGGALVLLQGLIPAFNSLYLVWLLGGPLHLSMLRDGGVLAVFAAFAGIVGLASGAYPALVLSRFRPTEVLRGSSARAGGARQSWLRQGLTCGQFTLSLVLLVTGVLAYQQGRLMAEADFGFASENIVTVDLQDISYETFQNETRALAGVRGVSGVWPAVPGVEMRTSAAIRVPGTDRKEASMVYAVSLSLLDDLELSFAGGQAPPPEAFAGGRGVVLNPAAVRALGLGGAAEARGQQVEVITPGDSTTYRVAGVVENFQYWGRLDGRGKPVAVYAGQPPDFRTALVRTAPRATRRVADEIIKAWPVMNAAQVRVFEDELYEEHAAIYDEGARLVGLAALLAVVISCLGLLGMAAYAVEARRKEVAVHKAMGASTRDIVELLSKRFLVLVGAAVAVGLPLAWWLNRLWLQQIPVHVPVDTPTLAGCVAVLAALAFLTVGTQALRATRTNPTEALRDE